MQVDTACDVDLGILFSLSPALCIILSFVSFCRNRMTVDENIMGILRVISQLFSRYKDSDLGFYDIVFFLFFYPVRRKSQASELFIIYKESRIERSDLQGVSEVII